MEGGGGEGEGVQIYLGATKDDNESLCAVKLRLRLGRFPSPVGLEL